MRGAIAAQSCEARMTFARRAKLHMPAMISITLTFP
jgi:hypothetical protein